VISKFSRENSQIVSSFLLISGIAITISGALEVGVICAGVAIWVMQMSESILLTRIQNTMAASLEALRKKQEIEIQDLLYFLRRSNIAADPFHSLEAAKLFVDKISFPAFLMSPHMGIIRANKHLTDILGHEKGECDGWPAARINDAVLMSTVGSMSAQPPYLDMHAMHTHYAYVHKSGELIYGMLAVTKISDGAYMMVFHPDSNSVITAAKLCTLLAGRININNDRDVNLSDGGIE
tara:strand:+ start:165 stop:875 length:711 start_codon:yes stop_codon:yes gene_type:complete